MAQGIQRKIYFAGSISGGRSDQPIYQRIVELLQGYGNVLSVHVADPQLTQAGRVVFGYVIVAKGYKYKCIRQYKDSKLYLDQFHVNYIANSFMYFYISTHNCSRGFCGFLIEKKRLYFIS